MSFPQVPEVPGKVVARDNPMGDPVPKWELFIFWVAKDIGDGACTTLDDIFFHGWKPLPTAASAKGGGLLLVILLHWAASIANGVPEYVTISWKYTDIYKRLTLELYYMYIANGVQAYVPRTYYYTHITD